MNSIQNLAATKPTSAKAAAKDQLDFETVTGKRAVLSKEERRDRK